MNEPAACTNGATPDRHNRDAVGAAKHASRQLPQAGTGRLERSRHGGVDGFRPVPPVSKPAIVDDGRRHRTGVA